MVREATDSEYLLAHKTVEDYRSKGDEVSLEAALDFLPGFRADLLVRKGDEVKVIEVKSRSSLAANPRISELARIIDSKPGWSFELLLVGEPEKLDSPEGARAFEGENILQRIEQAEVSGSGLSGGRLLARMVGLRSGCQGIDCRSRNIEHEDHLARLRPRQGDFLRSDLKG